MSRYTTVTELRTRTVSTYAEALAVAARAAKKANGDCHVLFGKALLAIVDACGNVHRVHPLARQGVHAA